MPLPTLSVIVPNYNHSKYLPRSLGALGEQSKFLTEIIVIDDGSTDNSVAVIQQLAAKYPVIKLHRNEQNMGCHHSVERAIDLALGDYLYFAAADDEVMPGLFEKSLALLEKHPEAALCATIGVFCEVATGINWCWGGGISTSPRYLSPAALLAVEKRGDLYIAPHSAIMKRGPLVEVGKFLTELKSACDWYAMQVVAFRHGICFVPEPLATFYILPNAYYQRLLHDKIEHRKMLEQLLRRLHLPENRDVLPLLREGGALYLYATPLLWLLLSHREYRHLVTARYLRKTFTHAAKLFLKRHAPAALVKFYLNFSGYRAKAPTQS